MRKNAHDIMFERFREEDERIANRFIFDLKTEMMQRNDLVGLLFFLTNETLRRNARSCEDVILMYLTYNRWVNEEFPYHSLSTVVKTVLKEIKSHEYQHLSKMLKKIGSEIYRRTEF